MTNPFLFFLECSVRSALGRKKEKLVINDLFNKFTFRYNQRNSGSLLIPWRYLKAASLLLFKSNQGPFSDGANGKFAFDGKKQILKIKQEYLEFINEPIPYFVFRDNLYNELNPFIRLFYFIQLIFVFILVFPVILIRKDKAKVSLIFLELTETLLLTKFLLKHGCEELLIFQAYEKDIQFISFFLLSKLHIKTTLVPSSNPISFYYKNVIGDTFIFTAPFQKIEYQRLKQNWYINKTKVWPPFGVNAVKINTDNLKLPNTLTLGLLSSASALRQHLNHTNNMGNVDYVAEFDLIAALKRLMDESQLNAKLIIYLHPLEKETPENMDFSIKYYETIFSSGFEFAPFHIPSRECFQLSTIGISGFSSSQMERLYGGYKTIFAPMGNLRDYFADERLDAISVQNYDELKQLIEKLSVMSDEDFYKEYNLKEYRWDAYYTIKPRKELNNES
jgi:hypothetical protein